MRDMFDSFGKSLPITVGGPADDPEYRLIDIATGWPYEEASDETFEEGGFDALIEYPGVRSVTIVAKE